jgi:iron-sulfur cluster repair di-iron protein
MNYAQRQVADIAANLPGATQVFRNHKIDFCCGGAVPLAEAVAARGAPLSQVEAELAALETGAVEAPQSTDELIEHILERYHATHRAELPELVRLAARVEDRHAENALMPRGIHAALVELAEALDDHMQKEEQILFPLMRAGGHPMITHPIGRAVFVFAEEADADFRSIVLVGTAVLQFSISGENGKGVAGSNFVSTKESVGDIDGRLTLSGGIGTVRGIVIGVLIFQVINYGMAFIGVSPYLQYIIKGLIIIIAVAIDTQKYIKRK